MGRKLRATHALGLNTVDSTPSPQVLAGVPGHCSEMTKRAHSHPAPWADDYTALRSPHFMHFGTQGLIKSSFFQHVKKNTSILSIPLIILINKSRINEGRTMTEMLEAGTPEQH